MYYIEKNHNDDKYSIIHETYYTKSTAINELWENLDDFESEHEAKEYLKTGKVF